MRRRIETNVTINKRIRRQKNSDIFSKMPLDILEHSILKSFINKDTGRLFSDELCSLTCVSKKWTIIIDSICNKDFKPLKKLIFNNNNWLTDCKGDVSEIGNEDLIVKFDISRTSLRTQDVIDRLYENCKFIQHLSISIPYERRFQPLRFKPFGNLRTLCLSTLKGLIELPKGLNRLKWLNIRGTDIQRLPNDITFLRRLDCSYTPIRGLRKGSTLLLEYLNCEYCNNIQLPEIFPDLKFLDCTGTNVSKLPDKMSKLKTLILDSAKNVKKLPLGMVSLEYLDLTSRMELFQKMPRDIPKNVEIVG